MNQKQYQDWLELMGHILSETKRIDSQTVWEDVSPEWWGDMVEIRQKILNLCERNYMNLLKYPKTYGVVVNRNGDNILVKAENGEIVATKIQRRNGFGHTDDIKKGLKVKLYTKNNLVYFRFVGS